MLAFARTSLGGTFMWLSNEVVLTYVFRSRRTKSTCHYVCMYKKMEMEYDYARFWWI